MALVTILGSSGFIGGHLAGKARAMGHECFCPARDEDLAGKDLGHVVYSIGLTADFRQRPFDTVQAHVCRLAEILAQARFESFVYLSSTRLYGSGAGEAKEEDALTARPSDPSDLYNLSKAMGESLCLRASEKTKVARLSNVYGPDFGSRNFLTDIIASAVDNNEIVLRSALDSAKDYISIDDATDLLLAMLFNGKERIYNAASGKNVSHGEIVRAIADAAGCRVEVAPDSPVIRFPRISTERADQEFGGARKSLLEDIPALVKAYQTAK
ncbi:Nucleoside-diphosphate-sugar epimerase [Desulfatibacillum alkenivorans DSM 16219]|jgi:nucleoside-diphosphate-sugar epimerase|uniref:Nucleoside-diphosphate-sugar epimerase n=1 Tax=Desulfatibacillum alkenivorans DSM 16219 TaxID=1121393 RepID=A0A1M6RW86_9BACT|nr:SDR family oxidoreductase [Desulfatibacillum alkenivorans]SHK36753.1 Nucleoside-diphosphate-sugar epimerase [Desulfatibacillum alkenivorans DSM 16219]